MLRDGSVVSVKVVSFFGGDLVKLEVEIITDETLGALNAGTVIHPILQFVDVKVLHANTCSVVHRDFHLSSLIRGALATHLSITCHFVRNEGSSNTGYLLDAFLAVMPLLARCGCGYSRTNKAIGTALAGLLELPFSFFFLQRHLTYYVQWIDKVATLHTYHFHSSDFCTTWTTSQPLSTLFGCVPLNLPLTTESVVSLYRQQAQLLLESDDWHAAGLGSKRMMLQTKCAHKEG